MRDRNLLWKLALIGVLVLWGIYEITPVNKQLKGGIDLVGGHSLLYEIDTTGLDETNDLSTNVMTVLKQRVDPNGVRNLVWRPVGDTRLEVQMPLPPKDASMRREEYQKAIDTLTASNISVFQLEQALALSGQERQGRLKSLIGSVPAREELMPRLVDAYDAWQKSLAEKKAQDVIQDLEQNYEDVLDQMLATNVDLTEVNEVLELAKDEREKVLESLYAKYPTRVEQIKQVVTAYDQWSAKKGPLDSPDDLMRLLRGAGVLEFHILAPMENPDAYSNYIKNLEEKGPRARPDDEFAWYEVSKKESVYGITHEWGGKNWVLAYQKNPLKVMDRSRPDWKLSSAYPTRDDKGMPAVGFEFNDAGSRMFLELTRNNIGNPLAIVLDDKVYSAPNIQSAISQRGIITGKFSVEEVNYLVSTLNAGSLEARLKDTPIAVNSIGPSLGQDNRNAGFVAAKWGLVAVVVFMVIYYMWAGAIADFALALNLLLLLAAMAALEATFTMAGIAGVILSMGMAVDANVLIFERMREEKERSQSLRLIIKNGFDRALPTIIDSNVTTIITCVVLYYIGTEEIKGFALTLGLGLVINIFTAVFVTKIIFNLLVSYTSISKLPMLSLIKRPNINWMSYQKYIWLLNVIFILVAVILWPLRGSDKYDIEFRGGTAVQIELKSADSLGIEDVRDQIKASGTALTQSAGAFESAQLTQAPGSENSYTLTFQNIDAQRVEASLLSFMDDQIEKGSLEIRGNNTVSFRVNPDLKLSAEAVENRIKQVAEETAKTGRELSGAQVQSIGKEGTNYEIVTIATSQRLVVDAIIQNMGQYLNIQQPIRFNPDIKVYPITRKRLGQVIDDPKAPGYVPNFIGGAAFVVSDIEPAVTIGELQGRVDAMRLQPDYEKMQASSIFDLVGLTPAAGQDLSKLSPDQVRYNRIAMVVVNQDALYDEDPQAWQSQVVEPEMKLLQEAMTRTSGLQKVTQFAGQVATQTRLAAVLALVLAFLAIGVYLWIRFGTLRHGIAANVATIHDILCVVGLVMITAWIAETAFGRALLIQDFKLNLSMIAAFLTLIGYSVNDTIIVFDRIRESQSRHKELSSSLINDSINQTLSRTIITSISTFLVMIIMYIFGGEGVRGFSYVMILGIMFGTYSSIAIASPLLLGWSNVFKSKTPVSETE
ncbi:MAG: protein translocase subunit SecD [Phycisphaerae bacterium]|nr:protein translocase subunit SecD [Phycisphaerae bacterium]